jgi:hypothetical protein
MLFNRIVKAAAVFTAAALIPGLGLLLARASGPDRTGLPELPGPSGPTIIIPKDLPEILTPEMIGEIYRTNEALADEKLTGKRVKVAGRVVRVKRGGLKVSKEGIKVIEKHMYELQVGSEAWAPRGGPSDDPDPLLVFAFPEEDRAALAQLRQGQRVIVEGAPGYANTAETRRTIRFLDGKLVKVED